MPRKKKSSAAPGQRQLRVGEEIRHALSEILGRDHLDDPDIAGKMVTVTQVSVSPDLRNATAFVTPFGGGDSDKLVSALNRATGYFRRELTRMVKLQFSPSIRFKADATFEEASKIERLLHDPVVARDLARKDEDEAPDNQDGDVMRRKKGSKVDGWLILDKPVGITSTQAVNVVKRIFDAQKAGHAGTLDPLATGILPIALGEATKTVPYVMDGRKTYRFILKFGEARSTDDAEGEVTQTSAHRPADAEIQAALPAFIGEIDQVPPAFSAIKVQGERAYDLARAGETVELTARKVTVHGLTLLERPNPDEASLEVRCGKGTYMRALGRDLAIKLGTCGHITSLRRTAVGPFTEESAISLETLKSLGHSPAAFEHLLPIETALDDIPALALTATEAIRLRSGQPVGLLHRQDRDRIYELAPGGMVRAMAEGRLVALTRFEAGELVPVRVMNH